MPHSEAAAATSLALPVYPELESSQLRYVADSLASYYRTSSEETVQKAA
jgi:dTDP-4-amino-4,6-dideoxygalactose transaminase